MRQLQAPSTASWPLHAFTICGRRAIFDCAKPGNAVQLQLASLETGTHHAVKSERKFMIPTRRNDTEFELEAPMPLQPLKCHLQSCKDHMSHVVIVIVQHCIMARAALRALLLSLGIAGDQYSGDLSPKSVALPQDPSFSFMGLGALPLQGTRNHTAGFATSCNRNPKARSS